MKHNISVIKSVWRRVRKPSRVTLDAVCSKNAVYTEVFAERSISVEQPDLTMVANLSKAGWIWPRRVSGFFASERSLLTHIAAESVCGLPVASK